MEKLRKMVKKIFYQSLVEKFYLLSNNYLCFIYKMAKVFKIGIAEKPSGSIVNHNSVKAIKGKGLIDDRHYKEKNDNRSQITNCIQIVYKSKSISVICVSITAFLFTLCTSHLTTSTASSTTVLS